MAAVQPTIPFRSRKRTSLRNVKSDENKDILNTLAVNSTSHKKTRKSKSTECDDEVCPAKISRKTASRITEEDSNCDRTVSKPLVSREKEIEKLKSFLMDHLESEESGSLYISGQPGTGKTACVSYVLQLPQIREGFKQAYVNCLTMKSAASIYSRVCQELQVPTTAISEKACHAALEKYLNKKHKLVLLVLDEIDQLDSKRQTVLYTMFEWAAQTTTRLVLVGVANALDLTERALPRLQARGAPGPRTLHFAPYTRQQIIDVFTAELASGNTANLFSPAALQMLAGKIAAMSGDMRRALTVGRLVVELAERSKFSENRSVEAMMKDSAATVELKQVLEVLNDVQCGAPKIHDDVEEGIPIQQKLILCSLMLILSRGKNKEVPIGKLYDVYKKVAKGRNIAPLDMGELNGACALLEIRGAVRFAGGARGTDRARRLRLQWDEAELADALMDKPLLASILKDVSYLS